MKIPFLNNKKDMFTLVIIAILVVSLVAYGQATQGQINDIVNAYESLLDEQESYYNSTFNNFKDNVTSKMLELNTTIDVLNQTVYDLQVVVQNLTNYSSMLSSSVHNTQNITKNICFSIFPYNNGKSNDSVGMFWFSTAKATFDTADNSTLNRYLMAKTNITNAMPYFVNAKDNYKTAKSYYSELLNHTIDNETRDIIKLYLNLTETESTMMTTMSSVSNHMSNACTHFYDANATNSTIWYLGYNEMVTMNLEYTSYISLRSVRNAYIDQIKLKLTNLGG